MQHLCIFHCSKKEMKIVFLESDASDPDPVGSGGWGMQGGIRNFPFCSISLFAVCFKFNGLNLFKEQMFFFEIEKDLKYFRSYNLLIYIMEVLLFYYQGSCK